MNRIQIKVHKNLNKELLTEWENLWEKSLYSHIYNSPEWLKAASEVYKIDDLKIFAVFRDGELVAVLPVVEERVFGIKAIKNLADGCSDKSSLLLKDYDQVVLYSLFSFITGKGNIYFSEVDSLTVEIIKRVNNKSLVFSSSLSPYISVDEDPFRFLSNKKRKRILNKYNEYRGRLKIKMYKNDLESQLNKVFEIEEESARRACGMGSFDDPLVKKFYQALIKYFNESVVFDFLYYGEKPIAYYVGLCDKKAYRLINTAYVDGYQSLMPGKILMFFMLERLKNEGYELIDFQRGRDRAKKDFTPYFVERFNVYISKNQAVRAWWFLNINIFNLLISNMYIYSIVKKMKRFLDVMKNQNKEFVLRI